MLNTIRSQNLSIILGTIIAIAGIIYILLGLFLHFDILSSSPVGFSGVSPNAMIMVDGVPRAGGVELGEEFELQQGEVQLDWGDNSAVLTSPATATFHEESFKIDRGVAYVDIQGSSGIEFPFGTVDASDVSGIYNADTNSFVITSGVVDLGDGETAGVNGEIYWDGTKFVVQDFNRAGLDSEAIWQILSESLNRFGILDSWFSDRTPPHVVTISPVDGFSTEETTIEFSVEVDEPSTRIEVNKTKGFTDEQGKYSLQLALAVGENIVMVVAYDELGNRSINEYTYTRIEVFEEPEIVERPTAECNDAAYRVELSGLVNNYRAGQGLDQLSLNNLMNQVACSHSQWMDETQCDFSDQNCHFGAAGSEPWIRCDEFGTMCTAENIAWAVPTLSAQQTFDIWKESPRHNATMLGEFDEIGIGLSTNYATAVFH